MHTVTISRSTVIHAERLPIEPRPTAHTVGYVVDRAQVNSTTRYSPEAPAERLYQVGLFTSALSHLYHGYF